MKAIMSVVILQLIFSSFLFSQKKETIGKININNRYWSLGITGGGAAYLIDDIYPKKINPLPGFTFGTEISYNFSGLNSSLLFSVNYTSFNVSPSKYEYHGNKIKDKIENIEISIGPRFFTGKNYFIQGSFGNYIHFGRYVNENNVYGKLYNTYTDAGLGFSIAAGRFIPLSKSLDLLMEGKIHSVLPQLKEVLYFTLNAGVVLNGKGNGLKQNSLNNYSIAVSGGITNFDMFYTKEYKTKPNIGLEIGYKTGGNEFLIIGMYNKIKNYRDNEYISRSLASITAGERIYIGEKNIKGFFEIGGGLYGSSRTRSGIVETSDSKSGIGITAGAGVMYNITSRLNVIAKSVFNTIFSDKIKESPFITLQAGLRWEFDEIDREEKLPEY
ncbi:MAG: hypothetical protein EHM58_00630 [Ignavibacteriae bacterium]|nr:MAG: hypothetical protein EHM58_00630 [Ignavibacteriota bacterium]